jgi:drug/metabolite transporter (DMT)-like permease
MVLYKKKVGFQSLLGAAMAILGAGVLSLGGGFSLGLGDGLTLLCAVCFAFQVFWTGEYVKTYRPEVLNFIQMLTAFVLSALGYLYLSLTTEPGVREITTRGIVGALYLGIASTGVAYLMQTACQRYVDETRTAIILSMESVFGTILSVIFLDERVTKRLILGSGLILAAVLVSEIKIKGLLQEEAPAE